MISSNENGKDRRVNLRLKVFVEAAHRFVLGRAVEIVEISLVPEGLEISTNDKKVDFDFELILKFFYLLIDFIKFPVKTSLDYNLNKVTINLHSLILFIRFSFSCFN
jgi:hypothetical protein